MIDTDEHEKWLSLAQIKALYLSHLRRVNLYGNNSQVDQVCNIMVHLG